MSYTFETGFGKCPLSSVFVYDSMVCIAHLDSRTES